MVTGTSVEGTPVVHSSNQVVVGVSPQLARIGVPTGSPASGALPQTAGSKSPGKPRAGVGERCIASRPVLHGASGPKQDVFTVEVSSTGIRQITFYLDGHKLSTLKQSQAKHRKFALKIDPRKLSFGAHRVSVSTVMSNPDCARVALANVFVHARTARAVPKFTG